MAKTIGLPKKYAKFGFKKGWKLFKAAKRKLSASRKATVKKKTTTKKKSTGTKTMAKTKSKRSRAKSVAKKVAGKVRYRAKEMKPVDLLGNALLATAGALVSSLVINKTPMVSNMNPLAKSATQTAVGAAMLFFAPKKLKILKTVGVGAVTAGIMGAVQKSTNMEVLAGNSELTDTELIALTQNGYLNGPEVMAGPTMMNGPSMMAGVDLEDNGFSI